MEEDISLLKNAVDKATQLCSVFDRITPNGEPPPKKRSSLLASSLTAQNIVTSTGGLSAEALQDDLAQLSALHPDAQEDTFFYLLQKYGWRIGRPDLDEDELQDESFCDYFRTKQALKQGDDKNGYLLVKGDLAGIQDYIYGNIQQKTAGGLAKLSKRLRGRSILITLLTDFLANVALRELELPVWNLLFAGGGHFNLLLPDSVEMQEQLKVLTEKLDNEMRRVFGDRLQLILASVSCSKEEIMDEAGRCFERLNAERERKKYQQHHKHLQDHFYPLSVKIDREEKDEWEISIGERFPKVNFIVETVGGNFNANSKTSALLTMQMHNQRYSLLAFEETEDVVKELSTTIGLESAQVFSLNKTDFLFKKTPWTSISQPISFGFRFLGKYVPIARYIHPKTKKIESRPQTFEEMTRGLSDGALDTDVQKASLEMLGAIRLDVDDLGYNFSHGIQKATLAQLITLSREMHYFFSAHFDQLAKEHHLYLIYSGGDDAFAVGQWKNLIAFAGKLQTDFQKFVCGNKAVHFSAGIFLGDPKYPVGRFYLDAGELLDEAKKSSEEKDRINIFHRVTDWSAFNKKIKFGADLATMLKAGEGGDIRKLSMAFAYRLLTLTRTSFYERAEIVDGNMVKRGSLNTRRFARNISSMRYLFARHGYDKAKTDKALEGVERELITDFFRNFKFGGNDTEQAIQDNLVALNYALYTIRSEKNINP